MRDKKKKGGMDKWWEEGSKSGEDNDEGDRQRGGFDSRVLHRHHT